MRWTASAVVVAALIFVGILYFRSPSFPTPESAPQQQAGTQESASPASGGVTVPTLATAEKVSGFEAGNGPNLAANRENFASADWKPEGLTVTGNAGDAPDGTKSAFRLAETAENGRHRTETQVDKIPSAGDYTLSFFLKPAGRRLVMFETRDAQVGKKYGVARFDIEHKTVFAKLNDTKDAGIQELPDGWLRCWVAMPYTGDAIVFNIALMNNQVAVEYPGDTNAAVLAWGVQLEPGDRPRGYSQQGGQ